ncbi:MAG TPA: hypothetical protein VF787_17795 [Thermoanaerobaculia bacterium]
MRRLWIAVVVVAFASAAFAQRYDVVLAGVGRPCQLDSEDPYASEGAVQWISGGASRFELGIVRFAPAAGGNLIGISGQDPPIVETRADGTRIFVPELFPYSRTRNLVGDAAGNTFVLNLGHWGTVDVEVYDAALQPKGGRSIGLTETWDFFAMDLAADQCTLVLAGAEGTIRRLNACANFAELPDFDPAPNVPEVADLRILPDGGVLIAASGTLYRLDANARIVDTFRPSVAPTAMMLTRGGTHVMIATHGCGTDIIEIDLATHAETKAGTSQLKYAYSIVPYSAWTAALGNAHAPRRRSARN